MRIDSLGWRYIDALYRICEVYEFSQKIQLTKFNEL